MTKHNIRAVVLSLIPSLENNDATALGKAETYLARAYDMYNPADRRV